MIRTISAALIAMSLANSTHCNFCICFFPEQEHHLFHHVKDMERLCKIYYIKIIMKNSESAKVVK